MDAIARRSTMNGIVRQCPRVILRGGSVLQLVCASKRHSKRVEWIASVFMPLAKFGTAKKALNARHPQ